MPERPIVIAGGGVAGAVLATLLARRGRRVIVVEKRGEGETKCCGGCLAPRGVRVLREIGLGRALDRGDAVETRSWRLIDRRGRVICGASLGRDAGAAIGRDRFDAALLDEARAAGAEIIRRATVLRTAAGEVVIRRATGQSDQERDADGASDRPLLIVGADGVGSGVARSAGLAGARAWTGAPRLGFSWSVEPEAAASLDVPTASIDIHLTRGGYLGLVRCHGGVGAGAIALPGDPSKVARAWARDSAALAALESRGARPARALQASRGFSATGPLPWRPRAVIAGGAVPVALVGDAAGYEEPFTGEGMTWAIESAAVLAARIDQSSAWSEASARAYARDHARAFATRRWRLRALATIVAAASRSTAWSCGFALAARLPIVPGAIVRSVVAA